MDNHKNFAYSNIAVVPNPLLTGVSLTVTTGDSGKFPTPPFNAVLFAPNFQPTPTNAEIVRVTNITGDVLTITRQQEGTTAQPIGTGWVIAAGVTMKTITDIENAISTINGEISTINGEISTINGEISNVNNTSDLNKPISTATQTALDSKADKAQQSWQIPTLGNSWSVFAGLTVGYMIDSLGFVHLHGSIAGGSVGQVAFTLPAGYQPLNSTISFAVCSNNGSTDIFGKLTIQSNGDVTPVSPCGNTNVYLDGITFKINS
jgi:hypothetical protein